MRRRVAAAGLALAAVLSVAACRDDGAGSEPGSGSDGGGGGVEQQFDRIESTLDAVDGELGADG